MYRLNSHGRMIPRLGCQVSCIKTTTESRCCDGFYGDGCEPCPGGIDNVCNGVGTCSDGIKGTGKKHEYFL